MAAIRFHEGEHMGRLGMGLFRKVLILLPAAVALFWASAAVSPSAPQEDLTLLRINSSRFMFLQVCSQCHEPERGYLVIGDPEEWAAAVWRMAGRVRGHITLSRVSQTSEVLKYGSEYSRYQRAFFEKRCGSCHDWQQIGKLSSGGSGYHDWTKAVSCGEGGWITSEELELIRCGISGKGRI